MGDKEVSFSYISKTGLETTVKLQQDLFIDFQIISGRKKKAIDFLIPSASIQET